MKKTNKLTRRSFTKKSSIVAVGGILAPEILKATNSKKSISESSSTSYDYIVVGSGAGGGPLAANLARNGFKVLVLEAGSRDAKTDTYKIPAYHAFASEDENLSWSYFVKHYSGDRDELDSKYVPNKGILYPRGATIGGSTAVNALITVYPHASDFEYIADLTGDSSWNAENMRTYFQRLENCEYLLIWEALREQHGINGWLPTNYQNFDLGTLLENAYLAGVIKANLDHNGKNIFNLLFDEQSFDVNRRDFENGDEGAVLIPLTMDGNASRHSVREYLLNTEAQYPDNLTIITDALVTKVVFNEAKEAIGVEYMVGSNLYQADSLYDGNSQTNEVQFVGASREVILSAGAFNTPQLLQLSGIGDASLLNEQNIEVIQDLPGVGKNLQDRYEIGLTYELKGNILESCTFSEGDDSCLNNYNDNAAGAYTSNGAVAANIKRSSDDLEDPDLFNFCLTSDFLGYYPGYSDAIRTSKNKLTWAILKGHTENTAGEVNIRSTNPRETPDINFKYFNDGTDFNGKDMDALVKGMDNIRDLMENDKVTYLLNGEVWPGNDVYTDQEKRDFIAKETWGHHACGTCRIGNGGTYDVLDSNFKVRGVDNLRVVDASVFPKIPGFFIAVPIFLISEKATDAILQDANVARKGSSISSKVNTFTKTRAENKLDAIKVATYPNPCVDKITFSLDTTYNSTAFLLIVDMKGNVVFNENTSNIDKFTLDTNGFSSGMYVYMISMGKVRKTGRFIKQ